MILLGHSTTGVYNLETDMGNLFLQPCSGKTDVHPSLSGKSHGITAKVQQYLPNPACVTDKKFGDIEVQVFG
jgi:hypothetical protein